MRLAPCRWLPLRLGVPQALALGLQSVFFVRAAFKHGVDAPPWTGVGLLQMAWSLLTLLVWTQLAHTLISSRRRGRAAMSIGLLVAYSLLLGNHLTTRNPLDWAVAAANGNEILHLGSLRVIATSIGSTEILLTLVFAAAVAWLEHRTGAVSALSQTRPLRPKAVAAVVAGALVLAAPVTWSYDEVTALINSARAYYAPASPFKLAVRPGTWPLVHQVAPAEPPARPAGEPPDMILLMLESVDQAYVEARSPSGQEYTPCLNALIPRGLYVDRFYGTSVQTCRGLFATLFSSLPSLTGKEAVVCQGVRFQSLPALLRSRGYTTVYLQAQTDLGFDNTGSFLAANGFDQVRTVGDVLTEDERALDVGWGVPDHVLYRHFLDLLDQRAAGTDAGRPFFAVLAPVANHQDWTQVPADRRRIFPAPADQSERYANSLHLCDQDLGAFVAALEARGWLEHGILAVTGDHGYPMGAHGIWHNQCGYFDESFRVPLLLLAPGRIPPERVTEVACSQLDIAPTLAEAAGLAPYTSHFQGVSVLARPRQSRPLYLYQPYSGRYLAIYRAPFKYIHHLRSGREYLFDLAQDPGEQVDLAAQVPYRQTLTELRQEQQAFYVNQQLYDLNRVWRP